MKQLILRLAVPFAALTPIAAQAPPPQEAPNLLTLPTGEKLLSWQGYTGRSYFLQVSDPTSHLEKWFWAPVIEGGADAEISYEVDGTADKGFFRIHHTDQVPGAGETLDTADFDFDGIPNLDEISPGVGSATHPLKPDTDGDGLPDGWERAHGLDPNDNGSIDPQNGASGMFQGGTVSNGSAFAQGVQANPNATPTDKDGDGLPNETDAEPDDGQINWKKTPEVRYVWIPQVEKTGATAVSRHGQILFPGYSDFVSTIKESEILWDSNTSDWVDMPANGSWSDSGLTLFNTSQVFDAAWDNITDMNDNGTVVGQSAFWNIDTGYNVPDSALMVWEMSGSSTNQYGSPTYLVPSSEYVTDGKILNVYTAPRIADDGTVSSESYKNVNFEEHFVWVVKKTEAGIHCNEMSEWLTLDIPSYGSYTGAILDHETGLFIQSDSDPAKYFLHYRGGGDAESLEGLLANTTDRITDTNIARTPAPEGSGQGRVWFSVKQDSGVSAFLEKRAGGSGVSRWHKPASMAEGAIRLNARGEAITPTKVWSNGTYTPINDLVAKPESSTLNITKLIDLASNGIILAEATEGGGTKTGLLLPVEIAPDKLASNGDFNEGDTGATSAQTTGAKADNRNQTLIAARDSTDGSISAGDLVTEDLHEGWFGLLPDAMPDEFFDGATITITKLDKTDPTTGEREEGGVRFFATWGENEEVVIDHNDPFIDSMFPNGSAPKNMVGKVYGANKTIPSGAKFWIEGASLGKITLEWRYQKGDIDIKHEQTFEIGNDWSKEKWQKAVRDEIYLDSYTTSSGSAMNGSSTQGVDTDQYAVANDFLPNRPYIYSVYEYYAKLHRDEPGKFLWAGLAKQAGAPVYAGLSDAQNGRTGIAIATFGIIDNQTLRTIQDILIQANIDIYKDLAYQFTAYRTGGIDSIEYLFEQGAIGFPERNAWKEVDEGDEVSGGNQALLEREQSIILRQAYIDLDNLADGKVSWMFSLLAKNPVPGGPDFQDVVPSGNIAVFDDRWQWITNQGNGMWNIWMGKSEAQRLLFSNRVLTSYADTFNLVAPLR